MKACSLAVLLKNGKMGGEASPTSANMVAAARNVIKTGLYNGKPAVEVLVHASNRMFPILKGRVPSVRLEE